MRKSLRWTRLLVALFGVGCGQGPSAPPASLTVLATASMDEFAREAAAAYEEVANVTVAVRSAGTHQLAEELRMSPTADLLLAAGTAWVDELESQGRIVPGSRWERVGNRMVILGREEADYPSVQIVEVSTLGFRRFIVPDPELDPAGRYARHWLENVGARGRSVWRGVADRREVVDNLAEVIRAISADSTAAGVMFVTDIADVPTGKVLFRSPDLGIRYSFALVERPGRSSEAAEFLEYLKGPAGIDLLQKNGFLIEDL